MLISRLFYRNGHLCVWESSIDLSDLEPWEPKQKIKREAANSDSEDDIPQKTADKTDSKENKNEEEMDVEENGNYW